MARGRTVLGVTGIGLVFLGTGFLVTARDNAATADELVRRGDEAVVASQVHLVGESSKNGDQYLSVDDAAAMLVAGVLCLLAVVLIVRADTRRARRRRAVQEARRLALYGPQDAVPPTPQDAPLSRRKRGRRRDHVGRHRAPPEEVARGDGAGTAG